MNRTLYINKHFSKPPFRVDLERLIVQMPADIKPLSYTPFNSMWGGKSYYGNNNNAYENLQYFYHSDHLGSTNYVTDAGSNVYQHIEYLPFGEVMIEERMGNNYTNYLFNAKEYDEESGFYYYSARYYDPKLSMFLLIPKLMSSQAGVHIATP